MNTVNSVSQQPLVSLLLSPNSSFRDVWPSGPPTYGPGETLTSRIGISNKLTPFTLSDEEKKERERFFYHLFLLTITL